MAPRAEWVTLTAWCEGQFQGAPTPTSTSPSANNPRGEEDGCKGQPWGRLRAGGAHELTSWMKGQHPPNNLAGLHRLTPSSSILSKISLCSSWLMRKWEPLSNQFNKYDLSPNYVSYVQISVQGARRIKHRFECFDLLFCVFVAQLCLTLRNPMDWSLPGFPVHGISQARILEWVAISFSRGSSAPRDGIWVSCIVDRLFPIWATAFVFHLFVNNILPNLRIIRRFGSLTSSPYTDKWLIIVKHLILLTPLYIHYLLALNDCVSD